MTTALERGEGSASRPGRSLPPGKIRYPCTGGWLGPRVGLDGCVKSRPPTGIRSPDRRARSQSLYRLSYRAPTRRNLHVIINIIIGNNTSSDEFKTNLRGAEDKSDAGISADGHNLCCNRIWRALYAIFSRMNFCFP